MTAQELFEKVYITLQNGVDVHPLCLLISQNSTASTPPTLDDCIPLMGYSQKSTLTSSLANDTQVIYSGHEPSKYNATTITVVTTKENTDGVILPTVVAKGVAKIEVNWTFLTATEWKNILSFFENNFVFYAYFYNQTTASYTLREMYVGDRTSGMFMRDVNGDVKGFTDCSLSLIDTRRRNGNVSGEDNIYDWSIE